MFLITVYVSDNQVKYNSRCLIKPNRVTRTVSCKRVTRTVSYKRVTRTVCCMRVIRTVPCKRVTKALSPTLKAHTHTAIWAHGEPSLLTAANVYWPPFLSVMNEKTFSIIYRIKRGHYTIRCWKTGYRTLLSPMLYINVIREISFNVNVLLYVQNYGTSGI